MAKHLLEQLIRWMGPRSPVHLKTGFELSHRVKLPQPMCHHLVVLLAVQLQHDGCERTQLNYHVSIELEQCGVLLFSVRSAQTVVNCRVILLIPRVRVSVLSAAPNSGNLPTPDRCPVWYQLEVHSLIYVHLLHIGDLQPKGTIACSPHTKVGLQ